MRPAHVRAQIAQPGEVLADGTSGPIEFSFAGRRFRIHAVLSRWCEAGGWWNRISDGNFHPDDQARASPSAAQHHLCRGVAAADLASRAEL